MSSKVNDQLADEFMDTLERIVVCPYCGKDNQLDPPLPCCGEVHAEEAWESPNGEVIMENELDDAFRAWLNKRGEV